MLKWTSFLISNLKSRWQKDPAFYFLKSILVELTGKLCCNNCRKWCAVLIVYTASQGVHETVLCAGLGTGWWMLTTWNNPSVTLSWGFSDGPVEKNPPPKQETWVWSLDWEDPLEKGMATHSSILAWEIPWTVEPGGLQSMGSQRVGHDRATRQQQQQVSLGWIEKAGQVFWLLSRSHLILRKVMIMSFSEALRYWFEP